MAQKSEIDLLRIVKKNDLRNYTKGMQASRPVVDTSLGFSVDGGYQDIQNLQYGKDLGILFVKDSEGVKRTIVAGDWDTILTKIKQFGLLVLQNKWDKEEIIDNPATTLAELKALTIGL